MCKICERMIDNRIRKHIIKNDVLDHIYLGFMFFRDSETTITMLHHNILKAKKKKIILGFFLDLQADYGSIYTEVFIFKCAQIDISRPIYPWLHRFLAIWSFKVA